MSGESKKWMVFVLSMLAGMAIVWAVVWAFGGIDALFYRADTLNLYKWLYLGLLLSPVCIFAIGVLAFRYVFRMSSGPNKSSWHVRWLALIGLVAICFAIYLGCVLIVRYEMISKLVREFGK